MRAPSPMRRALAVIQSRTFDGRDPATGGVPLGWNGRPRPTNIPTDYTQFLDPNGLQGARLGVTRQGIENAPAQVQAAFDEAIAAMQAAGATMIDLDAAGFPFPPADGEFLVLLFDFRNDVRNYFATRTGVPMAGKTLADAIAFNKANADREMPFFEQEIFELADSLALGPDDPQPRFGGMTYNQALEIDRLSGVNGIDRRCRISISMPSAPTDTPAWPTDLLYGDHFVFGTSGLAAGVGYPIVQVPAGNVLRLAVRYQLLRHRVQRAHADQARFRVRGSHARTGNRRRATPRRSCSMKEPSAGCITRTRWPPRSLPRAFAGSMPMPANSRTTCWRWSKRARRPERQPSEGKG